MSSRSKMNLIAIKNAIYSEGVKHLNISKPDKFRKTIREYKARKTEAANFIIVLKGLLNDRKLTEAQIFKFECHLLELNVPLSNIVYKDDCLYIYMDHALMLQGYLNSEDVQEEITMSNFMVDITQPGVPTASACSISKARCATLSRHLQELLRLSGATINLRDDVLPFWKSTESNRRENCYQASEKIAISFSECDQIVPQCTNVLCSPVIQQETGRKSQILVNDYLHRLRDELTSASEHKYGDTNDVDWSKFLQKLAEGCFILQMLSVSHLSRVTVCVDDLRNTRENVFVMYNYARLCMLFKKFNTLVSEGSLPKLPPSSKIDYKHLKEPEEWEIFWNYIFKFPSLLTTIQQEICVKITDNHRLIHTPATIADRKPDSVKVKLPLHSIVRFLRELSHSLSVYYNKIHILPTITKGHSSQMLETMFARIMFLKRLQSVMLRCFQLVGIDPPTQM